MHARLYWDAVDVHHDGGDVTGAGVESVIAPLADGTPDAAHGFDLLRELAPVDPADALAAGTVVGDYRIDTVIGHGGMGLVYRAIHVHDAGAVAIKVLRPLHSTNATSRLRFDREFEVARKLDHPHIVSVLSTGIFEERRYIVMRLIHGPSLANAKTMPVDEAGAREWCGRFATIARALNHAHASGIIHRDVKPSNVLVDKDGRLMLADFGIARTAEDDALTTTTAVVGTPVYMPPEQAGTSDDVDARSDVYSLGATIYHWFTGRPPFDVKQNYAATVHAIHKEHPAPVRTIAPFLPETLARVITRAMAKKPVDRYPDADALARDLDRVARGEPLEKPRNTRRERALLIALVATVLAFATTAAIVYPSWQRRLARIETESKYVENIASASALLGRGFPRRATEALDACPIELRNFEWHYLDRKLRPWTHTLAGVETVELAAYSSDEKSLALIGSGTLTIFDTDGWRRRTSVGIPSSPFGLAMAPSDGPAVIGYADGYVEIRHAGDGRVLKRFRAHTRHATQLAFAPDGTWFVSGGADGRTRVWSTSTGEPVREFAKHGGELKAVAVSHDGKRVITATWQGKAIVWQVATGQSLATLSAPRAPRFNGFAFSPDDRLIASVHFGGDLVGIWDAASGRRVHTLWHEGGHSHDPAFSRDGRRLVVAQQHLGLRAWNVEDWRPQPVTPSWASRTAGSGRFPLLTEKNACHVIDLAAGPVLPKGRYCLFHAVVARDGQSIFTSRDAGPVRRHWFDGRPPTRYPLTGPYRLELSPDGTTLFAAGTKGVVKVAVEKRTATPLDAHGTKIHRLTPSPDGRLLASASDSQVCVTHADSGKVVKRLPGRRVRAGLVFMNNATRIAGCSTDGTIRIWDLETGEQVGDAAVGALVFAFAVDAQQRRFATVGGDGAIRIFDCRTLVKLHEMNTGYLTQGIAFTPDGSRLLTLGYWDGLDVWDVRTGRRLLADRVEGIGRFNPGRFLAPDPSGLRFFSGGPDFRLQVWDGRPRGNGND